MKHLLSRYCTYISLFIILSGCNDQHGTLALGTIERDQITLTATVNEIITLQPIATYRNLSQKVAPLKKVK
ncbi:hypothetical protein [Photobacterium phosphoreum]|uniref:hypothetical protein n=1 Tax=Photobacterium phosphoreum TaxID=659 RepID=UPI00280C0994|nr:hypothetical protein [Photobacterium phosphoreum]